MTSRFCVSCILPLVFAGAVTAVQAESPTRTVSIEGITEYQFDNGLKLLLFPDDSNSTVTVNLTIFVGSRHEGYGEAGMAHLLEHMVFKGTPSHPAIPKALQERGARFNGTTWVDRTNYYETMPASDDNLEFAIRMEADRMLNSYIKAEDLASEMTVVRNEFERGENSPDSILRQRMVAAAYEWHNYGQSTIGNRSDIERVPLPKLRDFYRRYYQPDNAMVVVAGKFNEENAIAYVQKYFGSIPRPERKLDQTYTEEPPQDGERTVELRRVGTVGLVGVAYHIPSGAHPEFAPTDVLGYILAIEPAGRLYKALVETQLAASIVGGTYAWHDPGLMTMMIEVRDLDRMAEARDVMLREIERIAIDGVEEEEVKRVQQQILSERERSLSNTSRVAIELSEWASQGDWRLFFLYRDRIEKVTADDVKAMAAKYLRHSNRTVGTFIPAERADSTPVPAAPDVAAMVSDYQGREVVAAGEEFVASPANIEARSQTIQIGDNVKATLLAKKTRGESVSLRLSLRYGNDVNLKGYETACAMLPDLMTRGTKQLNFQQLKDELDKNRATLNTGGSVGSSLGVATFLVTTKRPYLGEVLGLLRQVLREPTLPQAELDVLQREQLAALEQGKTDPSQLAATDFRRILSPYPQGHVRYVPTIDEQISRLASLTRDQVLELYQFLGAEGELVIVGDFDIDEVRPQLESLFGEWKSQQPYARVKLQTFDNIEGGQRTILTPDKANTVYYGGMTAPIDDSHPDYPAIVVGNFIFGGGSLSSRLGDRVRQREGLSYGIGSFFSASTLDPYSRLGIFAISNPENSPKVVQAIQEELELLLEKGITAEELARAKTGYLESQQVSRTNDTQLASTLAENLEADRTMAHVEAVEQRIQALTEEDVMTALRKYFSVSKLVSVVAGDFKESTE